MIILLLLISIKLHAQPGPEEAVKRLGPNPVFFIDSVKVTQADLQKYDPQSIASVTILKDSAMIKSYGGEVNQGVVLIETRNFARRRFVKFLKSVSAKYDSLYTTNGDDNSFCYILNDKVQKGSYEGNLSGLDEKLFISLEVLSADELKNRFEVADKKYGIWIRANKPENLYNKDKKL
ncbi:hypothetical protein [Arcticibacter sp. MXS-1]|uniref:hypothetical protein n=1 Tax=Arcticibacter sp. MXS-1 TaxID=3341726 RepID=UPI0035A96674